MIYIKLSGRIGNHLFQIAAGASLAKQYNTDFCALVAPDGDAIDVDGGRSMWEYLFRFKENIFREIHFVRSVPNDVPICHWNVFRYNPIPYTGGNLLLEGYFQSEKYFDKLLVRDLFSPSSEIRISLYNRYQSILGKHPTCINVRRGDYCKLPHRFNICSMSYFKKAIQIIGADSCFLVVSDDIKWCKKHFKGDNFFFTDDKRTILEDLYLQSMCSHNIISNSSFSWWGAWLNSNPNKKVVYPFPWFGPHNAHCENNDLCPDTWIGIHNRKSFYFQLKSIIIRAKMKWKVLSSIKKDNNSF